MLNKLTILVFVLVFSSIWIYHGFLVYKKNQSRGGDGGDIYIVARNMRGAGTIESRGGDGSIGGKGGQITLVSEDNDFNGQINTSGGMAAIKGWYFTWWGSVALSLVASLLANGIWLALSTLLLRVSK